MARRRSIAYRLGRYYFHILERSVRRSDLSQYSLILAAGALVGVLAGGGAVAFRLLIEYFHMVFFTQLPHAFAFMGDSYVILAPGIGALLGGALVHLLAPDAGGSGIPQVMEAVVAQGGKIRGRVAVVKALASSLTAGSGGSVGREGPIVHIGSALGSLIAQVCGLNRTRIRTLLACGAAAGIAATFNSPLAGAFFAHEIILSEVGAESFAAVVVSAVTASVIGHAAFGDSPAFLIPEYKLATLGELPFFFVLGLAAAAAAVVFTRVLYAVQDLFAASRLPIWLTAAIGGLLVGLIGYFYPAVRCIGYDRIREILIGQETAAGLLLLLCVLKIVATSLSIGSGGSGGLVAPSLFIGAVLGAGLARLTASYTVTTTPAYALVGMGATFAAASHAPITSVLTVFELTRDYSMILPLMLACGVATIAARMMYRFSIFNFYLVRRGIHYSLSRDTRLLDQITVSEAMATDIMTVPPDMPVSQAAHLFDQTKHHGFPIADDNGILHGIISLGDVREALARGRHNITVQEAGTHDLIVAFPDETLNDALRKLGLRDIGRLPVVERDCHTRLVGLVTRKNIIGAYNRALVKLHTHLDETVKPEHIE